MAKAQVAEKAESATYEVSYLVENAQKLFNVPPEVMAGALYETVEAVTIEQAEEKLGDFLARPIKN